MDKLSTSQPLRETSAHLEPLEELSYGDDEYYVEDVEEEEEDFVEEEDSEPFVSLGAAQRGAYDDDDHSPDAIDQTGNKTGNEVEESRDYEKGQIEMERERPSDNTPRDFEFDMLDNKFNVLYTEPKIETTPDISSTPGRDLNFVLSQNSYVAASV